MKQISRLGGAIYCDWSASGGAIEDTVNLSDLVICREGFDKYCKINGNAVGIMNFAIIKLISVVMLTLQSVNLATKFR